MVLSARNGIAGTSRALLELLKGMAAVPTDAEIVLLCSADGEQLVAGQVPFRRITFPRMVARGAPRLLTEHIALPLIARRLGCDVFHSPTFVAPFGLSCASIVTVHDMTFFTHASSHSPVKVRYFGALIPLSVKLSQATIADSQSTRQEILRLVDVPPDRVFVVPLGVDLSVFRPQDVNEIADVRAKYGLSAPYLLTVAQVHPRKNHRVVIAALDLLRPLGFRPTYVIAGRKFWGTKGLEDEISARHMEDQVRLLGEVPDRDLPALYSGATAMIYPSLFEGFGLPIIEAMACRVPCIISNASSLPEAGGDAALYFEPSDSRALAVQIRRVLADHNLRSRMAASGLERAKSFTWIRTAQQTLKLYELAAARWRATNSVRGSRAR